MSHPGLSQPAGRSEAAAPTPRRRRLQRISRGASPVVGLLAVLTAAAVLFVEASAPAGTFAVFGAGTNNGSSFAAVAVYAPPSLTSLAAVDTGVRVTFPAAQPNNNGNGNGYAISGMNFQPPGAAAPNCATQSYTAGTFRGAAALASPTVVYTDALSGVAVGPVQNYAGSYSCFQVQTGYSTAAPAAWTQVPGISGAGTQGWYSVQNPLTAGTRIGFYSDSIKDPNNYWVVNQPATSFTTPGMALAVNQAEDNFTWPAKGFAVGAGTPTVTIAALGAGNTIAVNTTITLHYASVPASQPVFGGAVCFRNGAAAANTIYLADPLAAGNCTYDEIGILKGGTIAGAGTGTRVAATYTWGVPTSQDLQVKFTAASALTVTGAAWTDTPETATTAMPVTVGQKFTVHYAAPTNQPTVSGNVCYDQGANTLDFADPSGSATCGGYRLGKATAGTLTGGAGGDLFAATYAWTTSQLMTVTITNLNGHAADVLSNNWNWTSALATDNQELFVNDVFTFTFAGPTNQPNYNPYVICLDGANTIYLADPTGVCAADYVGLLTGGTNTSNNSPGGDAINVTWAWNGAGTVLTGTVTSLNGNAGDLIGGTWAFTKSTISTDMQVVATHTFVVHYNQPTNQPVFPVGDVVCFTNNGIGGANTVFLARPAAGCNAATTDDVGYLVGGATAFGFGGNSTMAATYVWTDSQTLTITITNINGNIIDMSGSWTFEPSITGAGTRVKTASAALSVCSPPPAGQLATQSCWPINS